MLYYVISCCSKNFQLYYTKTFSYDISLHVVMYVCMPVVYMLCTMYARVSICKAMCMCIHIHKHIYIYICMHVYVNIYTYIRAYVYIYIYICTCTHACTHVYNVYTHTKLCIHLLTHTCIHMYIYICLSGYMYLCMSRMLISACKYRMNMQVRLGKAR